MLSFSSLIRTDSGSEGRWGRPWTWGTGPRAIGSESNTFTPFCPHRPDSSCLNRRTSSNILPHKSKAQPENPQPPMRRPREQSPSFRPCRSLDGVRHSTKTKLYHTAGVTNTLTTELTAHSRRWLLRSPSVDGRSTLPGTCWAAPPRVYTYIVWVHFVQRYS